MIKTNTPFTMDDLEVLARTIYGEGGFDVSVAVGQAE